MALFFFFSFSLPPPRVTHGCMVVVGPVSFERTWLVGSGSSKPDRPVVLFCSDHSEVLPPSLVLILSFFVSSRVKRQPGWCFLFLCCICVSHCLSLIRTKTYFLFFLSTNEGKGVGGLGHTLRPCSCLSFVSSSFSWLLCRSMVHPSSLALQRLPPWVVRT